MDEKSSSVDLLYTYSSESYLVGFVSLLKEEFDLYDWIFPGIFYSLATSHSLYYLRHGACVNASCAHKVTNAIAN